MTGAFPARINSAREPAAFRPIARRRQGGSPTRQRRSEAASRADSDLIASKHNHLTLLTFAVRRFQFTLLFLGGLLKIFSALDFGLNARIYALFLESFQGGFYGLALTQDNADHNPPTVTLV